MRRWQGWVRQGGDSCRLHPFADGCALLVGCVRRARLVALRFGASVCCSALSPFRTGCSISSCAVGHADPAGQCREPSAAGFRAVAGASRLDLARGSAAIAWGVLVLAGGALHSTSTRQSGHSNTCDRGVVGVRRHSPRARRAGNLTRLSSQPSESARRTPFIRTSLVTTVETFAPSRPLPGIGCTVPLARSAR